MVVAAGVRLGEAGVAEVGGVEPAVQASQDGSLGPSAEGSVQQVLAQRRRAVLEGRHWDPVGEADGPAEHARVVVGPVEGAHAADLAVVVDLHAARGGAVASCQHVLDACNHPQPWA